MGKAPAAPKLELDGPKAAKMMRPNLIVPQGADQYRLPKGYVVPDEKRDPLGKICEC